MTTLHLENIGQIQKADITFGDLTVFVGPQATGKSIALQFLKLLIDTHYIQSEFKRYGLDWSNKITNFFDIYFGEGMGSIWREGESLVRWDGEVIQMASKMTSQKTKKDESLFFIPAQRVLTLRDGWPRPFGDFSSGDPFIVRTFSEKLRLLLDQELGAYENIFPQPKRLQAELQNLLGESLFASFTLQVNKERFQKRLVLEAGQPDEVLPFMVWSAGQREFVPLLLGFYWLIPPSTRNKKRDKIKWVVIEELEMGLHPQAISVVLLLVLELLRRGYKVCLSTHSPHILDVVWGLGIIQKYGADARFLLEIFNTSESQEMLSLAQSILKKKARVFYFDRQGETHDISNLDPGIPNIIEAGWGGLSEFSGRVTDVVGRVVAGGSEIK